MKAVSLMIALVILSLAPALRAQDEFPDERLPFNSPDAKKLVAEVRSGDAAGALKQAQALAKHQPDNLEAVMIAGLLHADAGDYPEALAAFERGVRGQPSDLPFLVVAARLHATRAELGPGGAYVPGGVRYNPDRSTAPERLAFQRHEYLAAAACLEKAIALRPVRTAYQIRRVTFLLQGDSAQAAFDATDAYLKNLPDSPELWLARAKAAAAIGRWTDATAAANRELALRPGAAEAYEVLARVADHEGNAAAADDHRRRARFYAYLRPEFAVAYTPENAAAVESVAAFLSPEERTEAATREVSARARATIDRLIATRTEDSTRLLATICWHHAFHGSVEDGIYAELEARRAEPTLRALFTDAQSLCTVGSCALGLARLHSEAGFRLIVDRLPADRNTFAMNIPEALAIYHRPETVPLLAFTLRDAITSLEKEKDPVANLMTSMGTSMLASRCIWALATFPEPAATTALEEASQHERYRAEALAALLNQTSRAEYGTRLIAELKRSPAEAEWIGHHLRPTHPAEADAADAIAAAYKANRKRNK
ncbi:MAG TPA: tetratricopeptide repeat protein [Opitutaceae bacterium]|nr:tetratricopeptide repeat protein [Opitutaceae bacterium]